MEATSLAARAASLLLDVSARSLLVFGLAGLAWLCLRRASAASRHALWTVTILALLCLPLLRAFLPSWVVPVHITPVVARLRTVTDGNHAVQAVPSPTSAPLPARGLPDYPAAQNEPRNGSSFPSSTSSAPATPSPTASVRADRLASVVAPPPTAPMVIKSTVAKAAAPNSTLQFTPSLCLLIVWMAGVIAVATRILIGLAAAWRLVRRCRPVTTGSLVEAAAQARRVLAVARPVSVREGTSATTVPVPMTFGLVRPTVLLPDGAEEWPAERLRVVLLHETGHIRRMDWAAAMLVQVACALYWFHPLVWLAARRLQADGEEACDDLVVSSGVPAPDYAAQLLEVARGMAARRAPMAATVTMAHGPEVAGRLRTILAENKNRATVTRRGVLLGLAGTLGLMVPLAAIHPVSAAAPRNLVRGSHESPTPLKLTALWDPNRLAAAMAGKSRWDVTLANRIRVRLIAAVVSDSQGNVVSSWTPDGTPLIPLNTDLVRRYGAGPCQFLCGIVCPSERLQNEATISFGRSGRSSGWTMGLPPWQGGQPSCVPILAGGGEEGRGTLDLTVATGPRMTLIAAPFTRGATRRLPTGEWLTLSRPVVHEWLALGHQVATTEVTATLPSRFVRHATDYSFEVIGRSGGSLRVQHAGSSIPDTSRKMTHISFSLRTSELPSNRVREFRLMFRPSRTVVFRNVALRPKPRAGAAGSPVAPALTGAAAQSAPDAGSGSARWTTVLPDGSALRLMGVASLNPNPKDTRHPYGPLRSPDGSPGE